MLVVIILLIILIEPNAATGPNSQKPASTKTGTSKPVAALTESAAISMKQTSIESILSVPALDEQDGNEFVMDDNHKLEELYLKFYGKFFLRKICIYACNEFFE